MVDCLIALRCTPNRASSGWRGSSESAEVLDVRTVGGIGIRLGRLDRFQAFSDSPAILNTRHSSTRATIRCMGTRG